MHSPMISPLQSAALLLLAVISLSVYVHRRRVRSIAQLPSPAPGSWLVGESFHPTNGRTVPHINGQEISPICFAQRM